MLLENPSHLVWWLTLWRTQGVGSATLRALHQHYADPQDIFSASYEELSALGLKRETIAAISELKGKPSQAAQKDLAWCAQDNHYIVAYDSPWYPPLLAQTVGAPALLFLVGDVSNLLNAQLAMVGSRSASTLGKQTAFDFARTLAKNGLTITSGLALGIDTASHEGALAAHGKTVAVLGTGVDVIYPAQNKKLATQIIAQGGALISEAPLGTAAQPSLFPRRNRIISGLSLGVLIVEAAIKSGSLITARLAAEQGRDVFAIPGSIHSPVHKGCHQLIREGATLVETAQEITEQLGVLAQFQRDALQEIKTDFNRALLLDNTLLTILKNIGFEPTPTDLIIDRCSISVAQATQYLMQLELDGWITQEAGGFMKTRKAGGVA